MVFLIKNEETIVQTIITSTQTKTHFLTDQTKKKKAFSQQKLIQKTTTTISCIFKFQSSLLTTWMWF